MKSDLFIENKEARENVVSRIEVLDKVKEVLLLPNTELMTTNMVAEYFEVDKEVINKVIQRNREELNENGVKVTKYREIKEKVNKDNLSTYKISKRGATTFTKRGLLNVAMLLRDSKIAKEIRNQLLNVFENATVEQKTFEIEKEKKLAMDVLFNESEEDKLLAFKEYKNYKDKHINQLNETIQKQEKVIEEKTEVLEGLIESIPLSEKRQIINRIVRKNGTNFGSRWNYLYREFDNKFHMNLKKRTENFNKKNSKKFSILDYIEYEMRMLDELYEVCVKFYENDVKLLVNQLYDLNYVEPNEEPFISGVVDLLDKFDKIDKNIDKSKYNIYN